MSGAPRGAVAARPTSLERLTESKTERIAADRSPKRIKEARSEGNEQIKRMKTEKSMVEGGKPGGRANVHCQLQTRLPTLLVRDIAADETREVWELK
jgi:hypothetical protein